MEDKDMDFLNAGGYIRWDPDCDIRMLAKACAVISDQGNGLHAFRLGLSGSLDDVFRIP
jgi:hypothetical protein